MFVLLALAVPATAAAQAFNPFQKGQDEATAVEEALLKERLAYGFEKAPVQVHAFLNGALWWLGKQTLGSTADTGSAMSGRPLFISYSGYINVSCNLSRTIFAEAEFELYKGQKGEFKVTKLRGVWSPNKYFTLSLGRDFPPIAVQDQVYYPPSRYRLIAMAPYLYWSILHSTGWWDSGIFASGTLPLDRIGLNDGYLKLDVAVINGPGEQHHSEENYLLNKMQANSAGFMFEAFHNEARQPWDNNKNKFFPVRLTFSPVRNLMLGGSFAQGYYDDHDKYLARYMFGYLLYGGDRLTVDAEYGMLQVQVDPSNFMTDLNRENGTFQDGWVNQHSFYVAAGYKLFKDAFKLHFLELVSRFEYMDSWIEDNTHKGVRLVAWAGIRLSPVKYWQIKIAGALQWEPASGVDLDNNMFIAETVFEF